MVDCGLFFFNSDDEEILGNYALHAKRAVRESVSKREAKVTDSSWQVLSGDLFAARNMHISLTTTAISPDASLLDSSLREGFAEGRMPDFTPYLIGVFMCSSDALTYADTCMKRDKVAGYLGIAIFVLPQESVIEEISRGLHLEMTSLHSLS